MQGERARVPVEIHGKRFWVECLAEPLVGADGMVRGEFWDCDVSALIGPIETVAHEYIVPAEEPSPAPKGGRWCECGYLNAHATVGNCLACGRDLR